MMISIHIEYNARWGEQIYLCPNRKPDDGRALPDDALALNNDGRGHWFLKIDEARLCGSPYHYVLAKEGKVIRTEWGEGHRLELPVKGTGLQTLQLFDAWNENPADQPFFSSAFTQSIFGHPAVRAAADAPRPGSPFSLTLQCEAATIRKGQVLAVCGNTAAFGDWNPQTAAIMDASRQPYWSLTVRLEAIQFPLLYKFVILDEVTRELIAWEPGCNRYFDPGTLQEGDAVLVRNLHFNNPQNPWRGAGVAIPVFSLRSNESSGIGEFSDLRLLVDWAEKTHQKVIQILPVNDTTITHTWRDSYPYKSNSSFALNPMYIRLQQLGRLKDSSLQAAFRKKRQQLNRLPAVDYGKVAAFKWEYLKLFYQQNGKEELAGEGYCKFYDSNKYWLDPYAAFCYLRDKYQTADFNTWKESNYSEEIVRQLNTDEKVREEIGLYKYIQYHLHLQLLAARDYAHAHGIILKGDIPIGISRYSVDAWAHSHLFHLDSQAGAPPDAFDRNGQNWSFPTYNWQAMDSGNYRWFKERFVKMSDYFDAYRIDHILGFFRIWEIPLHAVQGLLGHFNPAMPLTPQQMKEYGFIFDYDRHALPYITDETLQELFDEEPVVISKVKGKFLEIPTHGETRYRVCQRFGSQRGVEGYFKSHPESEKPLKLKLFQILTEVLFVEDPERKGMFHPRINGMDTASFRALSLEQQQAYQRLHDDFFYCRHNDFWHAEAMRKLPELIHATDMLVCGEDLGMIPACVPEVMKDLRILSLEIQRMPKGFEEFGRPENYPYYSVCTTSSHDLSNIRAWWTENREQTQRYYSSVLQGIGQAPETAEPWICAKIIKDHLCSPAMLTILPLQDWLSIDENLRYSNPLQERINVPSNPDNYWHYRMHLTLEELLDADNFNTRIVQMIKKYDR